MGKSVIGEKLRSTKIFRADEKIFEVSARMRGGSTRSCRVWVKKNALNREAPASASVSGNRKCFPQFYVLVGVGASFRRMTPPASCPGGLKIDTPRYIQMASDNNAPFMEATYQDVGGGFYLPQGGERFLAAADSEVALKTLFGSKVLSGPANSPD